MKITDSLLSTSELLERNGNFQLVQDVRSVCEHFGNPTFRVAVFAPFNHGKSTLLNALLGNRTLPVKLIPTTGTAISIKHDRELHVRIVTSDGSETQAKGTEILEKFAVLDGDRRMREDVATVEVFCPYPLLARGVELIDLPGTNDMDAQDSLVYSQLLAVDLVIQVLDARKLFTLEEVNHLQEWLLDRGINTVIFVVNFSNLLTIEDQKEVMSRARYIASEFRANLPSNISNLYRVDALPALRARLQGDAAQSHRTGILTLESALHDIVEVLSQQRNEIRLPRVVAVARQVKERLEVLEQEINAEVRVLDRDRNAEIERGRKVANQLQKTFDVRVQGLIDWLSPDKFVERYRDECLNALCEDRLHDWLNNTLREALVERWEFAEKVIDEACYTLDRAKPEEVDISLPDFPEIDFPSQPAGLDQSSGSGWAALAGGIAGSVFGPWGAAAGAAWAFSATEESARKKKEQIEANYHSQVLSACKAAVEKYLRSFSKAVLDKIPEFKGSTQDVFAFYPPKESSEIRSKRKLLGKFQAALNDFDKELRRLS